MESFHWFVMDDKTFDVVKNPDKPLYDLFAIYNLVLGLMYFKIDNPTGVDVLLSSGHTPLNAS